MSVAQDPAGPKRQQMSREQNEQNENLEIHHLRAPCASIGCLPSACRPAGCVGAVRCSGVAARRRAGRSLTGTPGMCRRANRRMREAFRKEYMTSPLLLSIACCAAPLGSSPIKPESERADPRGVIHMHREAALEGRDLLAAKDMAQKVAPRAARRLRSRDRPALRAYRVDGVGVHRCCPPTNRLLLETGHHKILVNWKSIFLEFRANSSKFRDEFVRNLFQSQVNNLNAKSLTIKCREKLRSASLFLCDAKSAYGTPQNTATQPAVSVSPLGSLIAQAKERFLVCTGSVPSAGPPIHLPLNQQLTQSTPRPQKPAIPDPLADLSTRSADPHRGQHLNIAT
jgi:hypothetical protein